MSAAKKTASSFSDRARAQRVQCPSCGARPGEPCKRIEKWRRDLEAARPPNRRVNGVHEKRMAAGNHEASGMEEGVLRDATSTIFSGRKSP